MTYYTDVTKSEFTQLIEYDGNDNPIYVGEASPGSDSSVNVWRIKKITYDGNNNPISVEWANGSRSFNLIWDARATYTYS